MDLKEKKAPFFYCAKASRSERDLGCDHLFWRREKDGSWTRISSEEYERDQDNDAIKTSRGCIHPTVKPVEVMEWLIDLVSQEGDTVLDPFAGSGSTGVAAMRSGRSCALVDLDEDNGYRAVISGRLHGARNSLISENPIVGRREIVFEGELEDESPNALPSKLSVSDLFGL